MTIRQLTKRLDRLTAPTDADPGYDPALAEQWNDAAGSRMFELYRKSETQECTDDERAEYAHLMACANAWQRQHTPPWELANLDPTITGEDRARAFELRLRPFKWDAPPLTEEERRELAGLDARLDAERKAIAAAKKRARRGPRSKRARLTES